MSIQFGANMRRLAMLLVVALLLSFTTFQTITAAAPALTPDFGKLPLSFVPNAGQTDERVLFQVRSLGGTLFFARDEVVLVVSQPAPVSASIFDKAEPKNAPPLTLRLRFTGANPAPEMSGINPLSGHVNYFYGNDPTQWQSNVPTYGSVVYRQLYPGIDLRYDGQEGLLKGTFEVAAGADPSVIGWQYAGAQNVTIDAATGDLQITLPNGNVLAERAPTAWQDINGARVPVAIAYTLGTDGRIGFELGDYDPAYALQLDPTLEYSTYLGGSGADNGKVVIGDIGNGIYVTGSTESSDFPLSNNPFQGSNAGGKDVFVVKINAGGTGLEFATYIGGSGTDDVMDMGAPGLPGEFIFLVGRTTSADFPVLNPKDSTLTGPSDAFVVYLNADGSGLAYSSYLGGSGNDFAVGLTPGQTSAVTITGVTDSTDFPTTPGAFQPTYGGGQWDIFMVGSCEPEYDPVFSTYFGGSGRDIVTDIDESAITGSTTSPDFPLANPTDATYSHPGCDTAQSSCEDAFVAVIAFEDGSPSFSTYLGGSGQEERGLSITFFNMYVTGYTSSPDFPILNPFQAVMPNTNRTAFVTKFSSDGYYDDYQLAYSTYLGGSGQDMGTDILVNTSGSVYVAGVTSSANFPLVNPLQPTLASTQDAFISELSPDGTQLLFSTYLGGNGDEYAEFSPSLTLDPYSLTDRLLVTGTTYSTNFPTVNALQPTPGGGGSPIYANVDAFLALIDLGTHFVVNTMDDLDDGACTATHCSLREAINGANVIIGLDKIYFNLPGSGPYSIQPTSALPAIADQVILDGSTQPGYAGKPMIEINGDKAGVTNGLQITGMGTHVSNIVVNGFNGVGVLFSEGGNNRISRSYIGTDITGTIKRGNQIGVKLLNTADNGIGEGVNGGCLISGNMGDGVYLEGAGTTNNAIRYGSIGLSSTGELLGNGGNGVRISSTAGSNNDIENNKIAGNGLNGVVVESGSTNPVGVEIVSNFIYENGLLGIDLGGDGVTLNDTGDTDTGPNNRQNFPIINSIQTTASTIVIKGSLNSAPNTRYGVSFFTNTSCDASGYGEGEAYLGGDMVDTDATGFGIFSLTVNKTVPVGTAITTIAYQNMAGHTSEFSPCRAVPDNTAGAVFTVNTANDVNDGQCTTTHCSLREAITSANARSGADTINFSIAGTGPFTIKPTSALPNITSPITIDGTSQSRYIGKPIIELNGSLAGTSATGIKLATNNSTIKGLVVNGWGDVGILIPGECSGTPCDHNTIQGNYIGTNVAGTAAVPNGAHPTSYAGSGILVLSNHNLIGGTGPGEGNLVSGNPVGVQVVLGLDNKILGNLIGTNALGNAAIANEYGIMFTGNDSQIGDVSSGRNVISGNVWGLLLGGSNNRIWNNAIGTDYSGTQPISNTSGGFILAGSSTTPTLHNQIGGTTEQGNVVAYNGGVGIGIADLENNSWGNTITGNSIFANNNPTNPAGGLGIILSPDGMTPNDVGDVDTGPNNLQNFPVLISAETQASNLVISGTLDTVPAATAYRLDFYANDECDVSGYGEGQTPLTHTNVTVSASGDTPFNLTLPVTVATGKFITATTTAPDGSTSEFSACVPVVQGILKPVLLQPANNTSTTNRQPDFTWEALSDVTSYEVQLGRDNPSAQIVTISSNGYMPSSPLLYGTYYWRVRATGSGNEGWSPVWSVNITAPANAAPELNLVTIGTPTLTWGGVSWATGYEVVVDTDTQFTAPLSYTTTITGNSISAIIQPPLPLTDGVYYWRVRALATGRIGAWSSTESFTVDVP